MTNITILNIKSIDKTDYAFCSWRVAKDHFNLADYKTVYVDCLMRTMLNDSDYTSLCDDMFNLSNTGSLDNYYGHSMSVSDVVIISSINGTKAFYCDTFGWAKIDSLCADSM